MDSVYIFGPIHLFGEDYLPIYKSLTKLCKGYFKKVICTYPDFWDSTNETPEQFYDRTYKVITKCDLFIADVTSPSLGVGMELQMGQEHNIPCIAICKEGNKISKMVLGNPIVKKTIYYKNLEDLNNKLELALKEKVDKVKFWGVDILFNWRDN